MNQPTSPDDWAQYVAPAQALFAELFREFWMNDDDYKELERLLFKQIGQSYESMARAIATGVANGYPLEVQLAATRAIYESEKAAHRP